MLEYIHASFKASINCLNIGFLFSIYIAYVLQKSSNTILNIADIIKMKTKKHLK